MGGSSSKGTFFWQKKKKKKKKSPVQKAWRQLRRALPGKKRKKSILPLDKLKLDNLRREKHSQKRFSLSTDKKEPTSLKRLSLGNVRKGSSQTASPGREEEEEEVRGGLGKVGEQIKRKFSHQPAARKGSASTKRSSLPL